MKHDTDLGQGSHDFELHSTRSAYLALMERSGTCASCGMAALIAFLAARMAAEVDVPIPELLGTICDMAEEMARHDDIMREPRLDS